jgi:hypothetical protein
LLLLLLPLLRMSEKWIVLLEDVVDFQLMHVFRQKVAPILIRLGYNDDSGVEEVAE